MTPVVLDTHALVWLMTGSARIGPGSLARIEAAAAEGGVRVAAISLWEIAMLVSKARLTLDRDVQDWLEQALSVPGLAVEPLSPAIAIQSTRLPGDIHADPPDRLIVASARHLRAVLITEDRALLDYAALGHLSAWRAGD